MPCSRWHARKGASQPLGHPAGMDASPGPATHTTQQQPGVSGSAQHNDSSTMLCGPDILTEMGHRLLPDPYAVSTPPAAGRCSTAAPGAPGVVPESERPRACAQPAAGQYPAPYPADRVDRPLATALHDKAGTLAYQDFAPPSTSLAAPPLKIEPLQLQPPMLLRSMDGPPSLAPLQVAPKAGSSDAGPRQPQLARSPSGGRLAPTDAGCSRPSVGASRLGRPPRPRSFSHLALAAEVAVGPSGSPPSPSTYLPDGHGFCSPPVPAGPLQAPPAAAAAAARVPAGSAAASADRGGVPGRSQPPGAGSRPAPGRPKGGSSSAGELFNTLIKLIEAHLPAAQQHKLHELKQAIARLKAKKDRAGLHGPLDQFFALVHQWAPAEQWAELQACAKQAGIKLIVDGSGNVHIRKCSAATRAATPGGGSSLRKEMLKQQQRRASGFEYEPRLLLPEERGPGAMRGMGAKDTVNQVGA